MLSVILTLILFLVCVSACQAANPRQTAKSQTADRQASEVQTETTSHGTTSLDLTEPEISHEKERMESTPTAGKFDFETRMVLLNSGYTMPIMGLGTYALDHDTCVNSVKTLLKNGGRLIDTAYMYHNEEAVGEGVRDLQRGIVVIPGSSNPEHIKENLDLFGFELSDEEMAAISALDRGEKHDWY